MGIEIDSKLCNGCGVCVESCPCDVFRIEKKTKKALPKYPEDCMLCWICSNECPVKAVKLIPDKKSSSILSWG